MSDEWIAEADEWTIDGDKITDESALDSLQRVIEDESPIIVVRCSPPGG